MNTNFVPHLLAASRPFMQGGQIVAETMRGVYTSRLARGA